MSFVKERERRANAGSRMHALLNQEIDMEELFEYNENEDDQEFSSQGEEEDKLDSDFDLDSSEGEQEHVEEGKAMDKKLVLEEKRARRVVTNFLKPKEPKEPTVKRRKMVKSRQIDDDRYKRYSSRKNTVLNRMLLEDHIKTLEKKRASQPKRDKKIIKKLTQQELLEEAKVTEEKNKSSLLEWQQKEAERKENAKKKEKKGIDGPFIRYHSFADKYGQTTVMGRNLVTFIESEKVEEDKVSLELIGLIEELNDWRKKTPKPNKPIICPVTGDAAIYRDPHTNVPYTSINAYSTIYSCLNHEMNWSTKLGIYLGQLPSAKGVPESWNLNT